MVSTESRPYTATTRPRETAREPPALAQIRQRERRAPPQVRQRERQVPPLVRQRERRAPPQVQQRERRAPPQVRQRERRAPPQVRQRERPIPLVSKRSRQCSLRGCQGRDRARAATTPRKSLRLKVRCRRAPSPLRCQAK